MPIFAKEKRAEGVTLAVDVHQVAVAMEKGEERGEALVFHVDVGTRESTHENVEETASSQTFRCMSDGIEKTPSGRGIGRIELRLQALSPRIEVGVVLATDEALESRVDVLRVERTCHIAGRCSIVVNGAEFVEDELEVMRKSPTDARENRMTHRLIESDVVVDGESLQKLVRLVVGEDAEMLDLQIVDGFSEVVSLGKSVKADGAEEHPANSTTVRLPKLTKPMQEPRNAI